MNRMRIVVNYLTENQIYEFGFGDFHLQYKDRGKTNKQTNMHFGRHLTAFLMNITVNYSLPWNKTK